MSIVNTLIAKTIPYALSLLKFAYESSFLIQFAQQGLQPDTSLSGTETRCLLDIGNG